MGTKVLTPKPESPPGGFGNGHGNGHGGNGDGDGRYWGEPRPIPPNTYRLGMLLGLAGIAMLFMALTSAYVVREGMSADWRALRMPHVLLFNTGVLLFSSFTIEKARRGSRVNPWSRVTLLLGLVFVAGQLAAWREFAAQGVYLSTNPHSSFFFLLTGLHGLHILGGIAALAWVEMSAPLHRVRWVDTAAVYWHFMDGLWIYLLVLLFGWR